MQWLNIKWINMVCGMNLFIRCAAIFSLSATGAILMADPPAGADWKLVYEDNFDRPRAELDKDWNFRNANEWKALSSRWAENAVVENGVLKLLVKKEKRAGQNWTAASMWTKRRFKYGYFECRFKYAAASGINNAFWIAPSFTPLQEGATRFEVDINEGHYPDKISTNVHNWSDTWIDKTGAKRHKGWPQSFKLGPQRGSPFYSHNLDMAVPMSKIRISSNHPGLVRIAKIWALSEAKDGIYPDWIDEYSRDIYNDLTDFALNAKVVSFSGNYSKSKTTKPEFAVDASVKTSWATQVSGEKFIELDLGGDKNVACIQFLNGWNDKNTWKSFIETYKIEYFSGGKWHTLVDVQPKPAEIDLSADFHTYGLLWTENELVFYFDSKPIRKFEHDFIRSRAPVLLSTIVAEWTGSVTDAADGKSMDVDYVRVWQKAGEEDNACDY